jgi:hypothetical protein
MSSELPYRISLPEVTWCNRMLSEIPGLIDFFVKYRQQFAGFGYGAWGKPYKTLVQARRPDKLMFSSFYGDHKTKDVTEVAPPLVQTGRKQEKYPRRANREWQLFSPAPISSGYSMCSAAQCLGSMYSGSDACKELSACG